MYIGIMPPINVLVYFKVLFNICIKKKSGHSGFKKINEILYLMNNSFSKKCFIMQCTKIIELQMPFTGILNDGCCSRFRILSCTNFP